MAWAAISEDERDGLNVALNEATWSAISVDAPARRARLLLDVLSLPADGAAAGSAVVVAVNGVSRIAASLRMGWWNDDAAEVIPLELGDLDATVRAVAAQIGLFCQVDIGQCLPVTCPGGGRRPGGRQGCWRYSPSSQRPRDA